MFAMFATSAKIPVSSLALRSVAALSSLAAIAAIAALAAFSVPALAADKTLVDCALGDGADGSSFSLSLVGPGALRVNGEDAQLVSAKKVALEGSAFAYEIKTAQGNQLLLNKRQDGSVLFFDRYVIGGKCSPGATIDSAALDALVARTLELETSAWRLADCESKSGENGRFTVDYHAGFIPGTIVATSSVGPNNEEIAYVLSSFEEEGAAGTFYTSLGGDGAYSYSGLGRHTRPLTRLVIAHSNVRGTDRIESGENILDNDLGQCRISNLWHAKKFLSK